MRSRSAPRVILLARAYRRLLGGRVLRRQLDRQPLAPLLAAPAQNCASPLGLHAGVESMLANPALVPRTIRRLAHSYLRKLLKIVAKEGEG